MIRRVTLNGESVSSKCKGRVEDFAADLDAYARDRGILPPDPQAIRIEEYLGLSPSQLRAMTPDEVVLAAFDCNAFAYRLQVELNYQQAKVEKCKLLVAKRIEGRLCDYSDIFKYDDRRLAATFDDEQARSYYEIQRNCECFIARWANLVQRLDWFARSLRETKS